MKCRACHSEISSPFLNLGLHPFSNAFVKVDAVHSGEAFYPLETFFCPSCGLVQLGHVISRNDLFTEDYVYFSSFSSSWLTHAQNFAALATKKLGLDSSSQVIEVASNDGYLLKNFLRQGFKVLGIEPCASVAKAAIEVGVPTLMDFFGTKKAKEILSETGLADLICANNVLAHVPDLHDFVGGFKVLLKPKGFITFEFPHLLNLLRDLQYDTIYHEHYSYLSLTALVPLLKNHGLKIVEVERLPTHGGSLRLWVTHLDNVNVGFHESVQDTLREEHRLGLTDLSTYLNFSQKVLASRRQLFDQLVEWRLAGKVVAGYGAAAKGNTLFNYSGIRGDLVQMVADKNPIKQGRLLPGSRIPVVDPTTLIDSKPDFVLILPWNLRNEVAEQLSAIRRWGGQFVTAIPTLEVF